MSKPRKQYSKEFKENQEQTVGKRYILIKKAKYYVFIRKLRLVSNNRGNRLVVKNKKNQHRVLKFQ